MAISPISPISLTFVIYALLLFLCSLKNVNAVEATKTTKSYYRGVKLKSLLPSDVCNESIKVLNNKKDSLQVVHRHGPCSKLNKGKPNVVPTHSEILLQDQARVNSIHSLLSNTKTSNDVKVTDATTLPAKDGKTVGSGNYIVTVGLGTPKKELSLVFDTGSSLSWTQCEPCATFCYQQKEPKFDPSQSTSYANISCSTSLCNSLVSATGITPGCSSSTCVYGIQYGDTSFSIGYFGSEKLTLTSTNVFDNFYFGCGQNNRGLFRGSAGLLGLGRDKLSLVSQTASKYKKIFSYCLPSSASSTGFLTFGGSPSPAAKFTPLSTTPASASFYGLDFVGISVKGRKLAIPASVFTTAGAIIDSGTVITRLPPAAYSALRSAFRQSMTKYPTAPALSILDTCYDFSNYTSISFPKIGFFFNGGVFVNIDVKGIFYGNNKSQLCLAFAGNRNPSSVAIYGNVQQLTLEVFYDGSAGKVGFAPGGCT